MLRANTARGVIVVALAVLPLVAYGIGRGFRCWVKKTVSEEVTDKVAQAQHEWVIRTTLAERLNDEEDKEE